MASTPGFEPRPHWFEASALTTAPPLLPKKFVNNLKWLCHMDIAVLGQVCA